MEEMIVNVQWINYSTIIYWISSMYIADGGHYKWWNGNWCQCTYYSFCKSVKDILETLNYGRQLQVKKMYFIAKKSYRPSDNRR